MATTTVTAKAVDPAQRDRIESGDGLHDHTHGDMDTRAHERTFNGFISFITWNVVAVVVLLIFLALANS